MARQIILTIPRLPVAQVRPNARGHWRTKAQHIKEERRVGHEYAELAAYTLQKDGLCEPFHKFQMSLDFHSQREIDLDNLLASVKPWIDGFKDAGLIEDDKPSLMSFGHIRWHKSTKADERVEIEIEEIA